MYRNLSLENINGEIWKDIEGYKGRYQVSNMGRVKSLNYGKERIMKQQTSRLGYLMVNLRKDGKTKNLTTHRLVALTFIENKENKPCVDHINTIKTDNRVENLRFVTHKENNNNELTRKHNSEAENNRYKGRKHSEETKKKFKGRNNSNYKGFIALFPNGEVTEEMLGKELGEFLGVSSSVIINIAKSNKPYSSRLKKYRWLNGIKIYYAEDYLKLESGDEIA